MMDLPETGRSGAGSEIVPHVEGFAIKRVCDRDGMTMFRVWSLSECRHIGEICRNAESGTWGAPRIPRSYWQPKNFRDMKNAGDAVAVLVKHSGSIRDSVLGYARHADEPFLVVDVAKEIHVAPRRVKACCEMLCDDEGVFGITKDSRYYLIGDQRND